MYSQKFLARIAEEDPERADLLADGQKPSTHVEWAANALSKPETLSDAEANEFQTWYTKEFMGLECAT